MEKVSTVDIQFLCFILVAAPPSRSIAQRMHLHSAHTAHTQNAFSRSVSGAYGHGCCRVNWFLFRAVSFFFIILLFMCTMLVAHAIFSLSFSIQTEAEMGTCSLSIIPRAMHFFYCSSIFITNADLCHQLSVVDGGWQRNWSAALALGDRNSHIQTNHAFSLYPDERDAYACLRAHVVI